MQLLATVYQSLGIGCSHCHRVYPGFSSWRIQTLDNILGLFIRNFQQLSSVQFGFGLLLGILQRIRGILNISRVEDGI